MLPPLFSRPSPCPSPCPLPPPFFQGKNRPSRKARRKQLNVIDERRQKQLDDAKDLKKAATAAAKGGPAATAAVAVPEGVPLALRRFYGKAAR